MKDSVKVARGDAKIRRSRSTMRIETRAALLALARDMFGMEGFADASVDALAAKAGLTKGAIYHHFGSKQGLFEAVVEEVDREVEAQMQAVSAGLAGWELLRVSSYRYLRLLLNPGLQRIMLRDAPNHYPNFFERPKQMHCRSTMTETLAALVPPGSIGGADPMALTMMISGAINNLAMWAATFEGNSALEQAEVLLNLLLKGVRGQTTSGSLSPSRPLGVQE